MRIIAGTLGGRVFGSPKGHRTHPMSDKGRGGLFNTLGDITGLTVLDAFSGSGALGFEAISRGAAKVVSIESDKSAQQTIASNAAALGVIRNHKLIRASIGGWLQTSEPAEPFDIILCDPPYQDLQLSTLERLVPRLKKTGLLVLSWPGNLDAPGLPGLDILKKNAYGDAQLIFYGFHSSSDEE